MILKGFTSVKEVINQVYRDTKFSEELPIEDLVYWAWEALDLIKSPIQLIPKVIGKESNPELEITNYRAELPCDFHKLAHITIDNIPARYTGNLFHHLLDGSCCGFDGSSNPSDLFFDNFGNLFSPQASTRLDRGNYMDVPTFDINNNYLTINTREGDVCMAYWAIPTDSQGYPMVPDDTSYKLAISKYLIMKIRYIDWSSDPDSRGKQALYKDAQVEWEWYVGQASSNSKMLDISQMESLKNQFIRLIPRINDYNTFFKTSGSAQHKRIQ